MPELPEVEVVVRALRQTLTGCQVARVHVRTPKMVEPSPQVFRQAHVGATFRSVARHGKFFWWDLDNDLSIVGHLRMTGHLFFVASDVELRQATRDRHVHWWLKLSPGKGGPHALLYRDMRTFGRFAVIDTSRRQEHPGLSRLGPDALDVPFRDFRSQLSRGKRPLKAALLDQACIAGVGNIYADEMCFRAKVNPLRNVDTIDANAWRRLHKHMRDILAESLSAGGTTVFNYRNANGEEGEFVSRLQVFRKTGSPCSKCGTPIQREVVAGRSTHFCAQCQR